MKKTLLFAFLAASMLILTTACAPEEPPPPPVEGEEPPEPTPQEYQQQLRGVLGAFLQPDTPAPPDSSIQNIITQIQGRRGQLMATENGRAGLQLITRDVDEAIRTARAEERWRKLKGLCVIYGVLQPGNERYTTLMEYAQTMLDRPQITVNGFVEIDGELYAFMDLFDPKTGETSSYRRREGEEFHGTMRLIRIVGNQQAVELEYTPVSYIWEVPGPRERR